MDRETLVIAHSLLDIARDAVTKMQAVIDDELFPPPVIDDELFPPPEPKVYQEAVAFPLSDLYEVGT